jgi:hypothetical protein
MSNAPALEILERRLADLERKANGLIETINDLRAEDGMPPRAPLGGSDSSARGAGAASPALAQIKPDTFYGKKMQTAVREYLEMRKLAAGGATNPATPREIFTAITQGGFQFDTKDETGALIGLRALLRKRTMFFHKLPSGTYGLTAWYPDAKKPKAQPADDDAEAKSGDKEQTLEEILKEAGKRTSAA